MGGGGEDSPGCLSSFVPDKVNQGMTSRLIKGHQPQPPLPKAAARTKGYGGLVGDLEPAFTFCASVSLSLIGLQKGQMANNQKCSVPARRTGLTVDRTLGGSLETQKSDGQGYTQEIQRPETPHPVQACAQ